MSASTFAPRKRGIDLNQEEHISDTEEDYLENKVKTRKVEFEPFTEEMKGGIVWSFQAGHKLGKSITALMSGFFNSEFKDIMKDRGFEYVPRMLSQGLMPEIDCIVILDTECTWKRDLSKGRLAWIAKPLRDRIRLEQTPLKRKVEESKKGHVVNVNQVDLDKERENFEAAVWKAVDEFGPNTLILCDSLSDYKKALDDKQEFVFDKTVITKYKTTKNVAANAKAQERLDMKFWQYRNKWWHNVLIKLRTNNCWVTQTIKMAERSDQYRKIYNDEGEVVGMKSKYYPLTAPRSEFRIDQGYDIINVYHDDRKNNIKPGRYFLFRWGKYEHSVPSFDSLTKFNTHIGELDAGMRNRCLLPYRMSSRLAVMELLEDMGQCLMGEFEDDPWGPKIG